MSRKIKQLENENRRLVRQAVLQKTREATFHSHLRKIFTADQLAALSRSSNRGSKGCNGTSKKSLQMGFACGSTGYDLKLEGGFPLPSSRTLSRRLEGKFLLEKKVWHLKPQERKCVLLLDETAIVEKFECNRSTRSIRGHVTMGVPEAPITEPPAATHALVYMIAGKIWQQRTFRMAPVLFLFDGTCEAPRFSSTCSEDMTGEVPLVIRNRRVCLESEGSHRVHECATTSQRSRQRCVDFGDLVLFGATRRCSKELKRSWCVVRGSEVETHTNTERKLVVLRLSSNGFSPVVVS
ncbi:hypothetical protein HPB47_017043 [Ixodes persulcatus]|uniref:Uncharacterized protein n=1 Tax=Ixodes persulcatus TaxID=34615 RepID=A0AC60QQB5_IXOPE|nr:hypothetical protein HPB47_017043 [Ixodes persulcatus]